MKKTFFFLLAVMVFGLMGCGNGSPKPATKHLPGVDMVIIHQGQLQFYNHATQTLTPYEAEKDSVVNLALDDSNHLFYTTAHGQDLVLKTLDLSETDPQPKVCANWEITLDQATNILFGDGVYDLEMDDSMENLYLFCNSYEVDDHFNFEKCNIASGKTEGIDFEEHGLVCFPIHFLDHFYTEGQQFYYATPTGKVCLSDQIDFAKVLGGEENMEDMEFAPVAISPDGTQIVYCAIVHVDLGWAYYCVASADGKTQRVLTDSDTRTPAPGFLADGSLVYVGKGPAIKIDAPDGSTTTILEGAERFFLQPVGRLTNPFKENQVDLGNCDMAIIDDGKVTLCNPAHDIFIPLATEKDYVLNGVFHEDQFYYTVAIGDDLYLKKFDMSRWGPNQEMLTGWGLKRSDCSSGDGDVVAPMECEGKIPVITIDYNLYEEFDEFTDFRAYNPSTRKKADNNLGIEKGDSEQYAEELRNDKDLFVKVEEELEMEEDEEGEGYKAYYYYVAKGDSICLSDQIDFDSFKGEYSYEPQFELLRIGPARNCVLFAAPIDWGHTGHGPLCFSSLDGKVQKALVSDFQDACYGWLGDGRLAYVDDDGIHVIAPDGTDQKISSAHRFVTRY